MKRISIDPFDNTKKPEVENYLPIHLTVDCYYVVLFTLTFSKRENISSLLLSP